MPNKFLKLLAICCLLASCHSKNAGTIQGKMKGDLVIADYSFMSEGISGIRQVAFKKSGK